MSDPYRSSLQNRGFAIHFKIQHTWDGTPLHKDAVSEITLTLTATHLLITTDAPFYNDPQPSAPPGPTDRLWEHEVVEVFLCAKDGRYLEIELGPHGHYLVLQLDGIRNVTRSMIPITYSAHPSETRWQGTARLPRSLIPEPVERANAFAIQGVGKARCYMAASPTGGEQPDFHKPQMFPKCHLETH